MDESFSYARGWRPYKSICYVTAFVFPRYSEIGLKSRMVSDSTYFSVPMRETWSEFSSTCFGMRKPERCGYTGGEKSFLTIRSSVLTDCINIPDRQTNGETDGMQNYDVIHCIA